MALELSSRDETTPALVAQDLNNTHALVVVTPYLSGYLLEESELVNVGLVPTGVTGKSEDLLLLGEITSGPRCKALHLPLGI